MGAPYRHTQLDGSKVEPDPAARRKVRLAGLTTVALGMGIGASAVALGPLAAALGGGLAVLGLALYREAPANPLRASCPACGGGITGVEPTTDVVECPSCGEHACLMGQELVPVRHDFVARSPAFAVPLERAQDGLPPICAQCGVPTAGASVPLLVSDYGKRLGEDAVTRVVVVPHCDAHHDGAVAEPGAVLVRSRAHWIEAMSTHPTVRS